MRQVDKRLRTRTYDELHELIAEQSAEGPVAQTRLEAYRDKYRLANELLEFRHQRRVSQEELAKRTGIKQADVSRIERGITDPQATTLARLARALGARLVLVDDPEIAEPAG